MLQLPETERLVLREISPDDAEQAYLLNLDPEVIRYTGDAPFESVEAARRFLEQYDHYRRYGFGRWGVIRKSDGAFLGWCGLKYSPEHDEYDIGFRFFKTHWNQGYATEAATACLALGFGRFAMPRIVGRAMAANTASIRVLEKIGLNYASRYLSEGQSWMLYEAFPTTDLLRGRS
jgi:ribosomal-protein-alanine N-acetyltransferase